MGSSRTTWLNRAVVRNIVVTLSLRRCSARRPGDRATSRSMITTAPPLARAPQISNVVASKLTFEAWATRSAGPSRT